MSGRIAGAQRRQEAVLHIDYEAVLRQAVENERYRVLREVRAAMEAVPTTEPDGRNSWSTKDRNPERVKRDIADALDRIERDPQESAR